MMSKMKTELVRCCAVLFHCIFRAVKPLINFVMLREQLKNYFIIESNELIYYGKFLAATYWLKTYARQYGMGFFHSIGTYTGNMR